jgi:hypothetical protein
MLIELILTVCLAATGSECRNEHLVLESDGSLYHCMMESPVHIATWMQAHPKWRVMRWKCAPPGTREDAI